MKRFLWTFSLLFVGAITACGGDSPRTQLVVTVDSDLRAPSEIDRVTLDMGAHATAKSGSADLTAEPLPRTVGLVHESGPLGPFVVKATGWLGDQRVVEREVETSFVSGKTTKLTITLSSACKDMFCDVGMTCVAGGCELVERGGTDDAGTDDAGADDAGAGDAGAGDAGAGDAGADAASADVGASPVCSIDLPVMGDAYQTNARIALSGHCSENGTLTEGLSWSSDISGDIGAGPTDTAKLTEPGTHTISLCAPDPADSSVTGCTSVEILVTDTPQPSGSIDSLQQNRSTKQPFSDNAAIRLTGSGSGAGVTLSWSDNLQGDLGSGESVSLDNPVIGHHVVTLTVTDRDQKSTTVSSDFVVLSARQSSLVEPFGGVNASFGDSGSVLSLASDVSTRVYAGTATKSLYRFDAQNLAASGTQVAGPFDGAVQALQLSSNKGLAYLATHAGLTVCDYAGVMGVSSNCNTWTTGDADTNDMRSVLRMTSSGTDYLLVGTRAGLAIADKVTGGSMGSTSFSANYRLTQREVRGLAESKLGGGGSTWLATDAGLSRYNPEADSISAITTDGMASSSLSDVAEGADGSVWVGSSGGLGRYTPSTRKWTFWTSDDGLVSDNVQALAIQHLTLDAKARDVVWMATDAGVCRFDTSLESFMVLTSDDGLPSNNVHDVIVLDDGTKVFATDQGVARYTGP